MTRRRQNGWLDYNARVAGEGRPDQGAELRAAHVAYYRRRRHPDGLPLWWSEIRREFLPIPADLLPLVMAA